MAWTLFDKVWNAHVVRDLGDGWALLHIDRHLLHDLSGAPALNDLLTRELAFRNPGFAFATPDHVVASTPGRTAQTCPTCRRCSGALKPRAAECGLCRFDL